MQIQYPFRIDTRGRTAVEEYDNHVRQMIEQVLFTNPGERVNRPDFGAGLMQLIFAPDNDELTAATEFLVRGSLQQWLGDLIEVEDVLIRSDDTTLHITVRYIVRRDGRRQVATFDS